MIFLEENRHLPKEIEDYIKKNKALHSYFESGFNGIKPKNYCGFLSIEDKSYFIAPKISKDNELNLNIFIYMIIYAYDIDLKNEELMQSSVQKHTILEVFIRLFANTLLNELKKGLFKKYITMQENLKQLRGKYLTDKNFQNFYNQNIYCEFDEFSMDNELNRFFLFAIKYFKKFSSYANLNRCESILDEVTYLNIDYNRLNIYFDRTNGRYQKSYEIALVLLKKLIPIVDKNNNKSFTFLFDMAEVFEKFIGKLYKEIDSSTKLQVQRNFGSLVLKPDIVLDNLIIDTKYKLVKTRDDLSTQDKYQIFAYGINFKIKNCMLLYPKHLIDLDDNLILGKNEDKIYLRLKSIHLNFKGGYKDFIKEMKERLEKIYD
jgi:5-methylcytosine-specific restriction enzyme subunit McrC